jgi:hypothetical protein
MIDALASVRDYERLYWILHASEQQVPPVRAKLIRALDQQVQQLLESEIATRVSTAVSSVASLSGTPVREGGQASGSARPSESTGGQAGSTRASWVPAQEYADVEARLNSWQPPADPGTRMQQARELTRLIIGVEGKEEQHKLHRLLQQRSADAARQQIQAQSESASLAATNDPALQETEMP